MNDIQGARMSLLHRAERSQTQRARHKPLILQRQHSLPFLYSSFLARLPIVHANYFFPLTA